MASVKSFEECAEICKSIPPSLLIVQRFVHESGDGLRFVRLLKSDSSISHIPIIVGWADVSRDNSEHGYEEAFEAGANACFGRVFDIADVLRQIEELLDNPTATGIVDT